MILFFKLPTLSMLRHFFLLLVLLILGNLTACSTITAHLPGVYTLDIQQGNQFDQDMVNQLRPSMTKRQVLFLMGSPMLTDFFHQQRWDYLTTTHHDGVVSEPKRISLYFAGETLAGIQGDFKPDLKAPRVIKETTVDVPERDLEKSMWEKIVWLFDGMPEHRVAISAKTPDAEKEIKTQDDNIFNNRF